MQRWLDDMFIDGLYQPVSDRITRLTGLSCYDLALLTASLALCSVIGATVSMVQIRTFYAMAPAEILVASGGMVIVFGAADLLMIVRARHLKRTVRPMTASPERPKRRYWRLMLAFFVTIQIIVMNMMASFGIPPGTMNWQMLIQHVALMSSLYLAACSPADPPAKIITSSVNNTAG